MFTITHPDLAVEKRIMIFRGNENNLIIEYPKQPDYAHKIFYLEIEDSVRIKIVDDCIRIGRRQWCNVPSMARYEWLDKNYHFTETPHEFMEISLSRQDLSENLHIFHPRSESGFTRQFDENFPYGKNESINLSYHINNIDDNRPTSIFIFNNHICLGFIQGFICIAHISDQELVWENHPMIIWMPTKLTPHCSFPIR